MAWFEIRLRKWSPSVKKATQASQTEINNSTTCVIEKTGYLTGTVRLNFLTLRVRRLIQRLLNPKGKITFKYSSGIIARREGCSRYCSVLHRLEIVKESSKEMSPTHVLLHSWKPLLTKYCKAVVQASPFRPVEGWLSVRHSRRRRAEDKGHIFGCEASYTRGDQSL
jgi:hypothetical protein